MPARHVRGLAAFNVDEATHTVAFERELAAPPEAVFAAWTQPAQVQRWWDPSGEPLARCDIDLRVGGTFAFVSSSHPDLPFSGTYRQIEAPELLVFEALGAVGRVSIRPSVNGTLMRVAIACTSAEHLAQFLKMGVVDGTSQTLDNLVVHVEERAPVAQAGLVSPEHHPRVWKLPGSWCALAAQAPQQVAGLAYETAVPSSARFCFGVGAAAGVPLLATGSSPNSALLAPSGAQGFNARRCPLILSGLASSRMSGFAGWGTLWIIAFSVTNGLVSAWRTS